MKPIVQTYTLPAEPERVFRALTDPRELERWFPTSAESEPRTGGRFRYEWKFDDTPEKDHLQEGRYAEVTAPTRLRYPWAVGDDRTEVLFELEEEDGGTRLELTHDGWRDGMEEARQKHAEGWSMFLGNLESVLGAGKDGRAEMAGMTVTPA